MKKIKICFIKEKIYSLFNERTQGNYGGAEVEISILSKKLAKNNQFEINMICSNNKGKEFEQISNVNIWKTIKLRKDIFSHIKYVIAVINLIKKINPDILIIEGRGYVNAFFTYYCRINKIKIIYRVASTIDVDKSVFKKPLLAFLFRNSLKNVDYIIFQTNQQQKLFLNNFKSSQKKIIITNSWLINKQENCNYKKDVLWVGRDARMKKPLIFLKLAENFKNVPFKMIIKTSKENKGLFNKIKIISKKIKNFELLMNIPFKKIDKHFKKAKVLVQTSDYEGFPNTFIQAGVNGVPILSLNVNPDNVVDKCGFFCHDDFNLLKKNLKTLLENERVYQFYSKNAYQYFSKNYDINKNIKIWNKILLTLYNERKK